MGRDTSAEAVASMICDVRGAVFAGAQRPRAVSASALAAIGVLSFGAAGCGPIEPEMARPRIVETAGVRAIPTAEAREAASFVSTPGPDSAPGNPPATPAASRNASTVQVRADAP